MLAFEVRSGRWHSRVRAARRIAIVEFSSIQQSLQREMLEPQGAGVRLEVAVA